MSSELHKKAIFNITDEERAEMVRKLQLISKLNKVYDLLVSIGGADPQMKDNFIYHHTKEEVCDEWRFQGKLGFGGKYRSKTNTVDCYLEDQTPSITELINELNSELAKL